MKVVKGEELFICGDNKVGLLNDISQAVSGAGVNIRTVSAYVADGKAFFRMITSDNTKTKEVLTALGLEVQDKQVVILELEDQVGALAGISQKLKDQNVDLKYIYGTVSQAGDTCMLILAGNDNDKAVEALS